MLEGMTMGKNEKTGKSIGSIASKALHNPNSVTNKEIKSSPPLLSRSDPITGSLPSRRRSGSKLS